MDFIQQLIISLDHALVATRILPHVEEAREVLAERHEGWIVRVRVVTASGVGGGGHVPGFPVGLEVGVDESSRMARDFLERRSQLRVRDVIDRDLQIQSIGSFRVVKQPPSIVFTVVQRHVDHGPVPQRYPPCHNPILHGRGEDGRHGYGHFDIGPRRENRSTHPVPVGLVLRQNPFSHPPLAVIVTRSEFRVIPTLLVHVIQVAIDEELDPFFERQLVASDRPVYLRFLSTVEPVNVDKGTVTATKSFAEVGFTGERAFNQFDIPQGDELFGPVGVDVSREGSDFVLLVLDQAADHGDALGTGAADDEDV